MADAIRSVVDLTRYRQRSSFERSFAFPRGEAEMNRSTKVPYLASPAPTWLARAVGVVVLVIGVVLLGLDLLGVIRVLAGGTAPTYRSGLSLGLLIVSMVGLLCTVFGARLITGRTPHGDSLLSRTAWTLLGVGFVVMALAIGIATHWDRDVIVGVLCGAIFAVSCFGVALRPRHR